MAYSEPLNKFFRVNKALFLPEGENTKKKLPPLVLNEFKKKVLKNVHNVKVSQV